MGKIVLWVWNQDLSSGDTAFYLWGDFQLRANKPHDLTSDRDGICKLAARSNSNVTHKDQ